MNSLELVKLFSNREEIFDRINSYFKQLRLFRELIWFRLPVFFMKSLLVTLYNSSLQQDFYHPLNQIIEEFLESLKDEFGPVKIDIRNIIDIFKLSSGLIDIHQKFLDYIVQVFYQISDFLRSQRVTYLFPFPDIEKYVDYLEIFYRNNMNSIIEEVAQKILHKEKFRTLLFEYRDDFGAYPFSHSEERYSLEDFKPPNKNLDRYEYVQKRIKEIEENLFRRILVSKERRDSTKDPYRNSVYASLQLSDNCNFIDPENFSILRNPKDDSFFALDYISTYHPDYDDIQDPIPKPTENFHEVLSKYHEKINREESTPWYIHYSKRDDRKGFRNEDEEGYDHVFFVGDPLGELNEKEKFCCCFRKQESTFNDQIRKSGHIFRSDDLFQEEEIKFIYMPRNFRYKNYVTSKRFLIKMWNRFMDHVHMPGIDIPHGIIPYRKLFFKSVYNSLRTLPQSLGDDMTIIILRRLINCLYEEIEIDDVEEFYKRYFQEDKRREKFSYNSKKDNYFFGIIHGELLLMDTGQFDISQFVCRDLLFDMTKDDEVSKLLPYDVFERMLDSSTVYEYVLKKYDKIAYLDFRFLMEFIVWYEKSFFDYETNHLDRRYHLRTLYAMRKNYELFINKMFKKIFKKRSFGKRRLREYPAMKKIFLTYQTFLEMERLLKNEIEERRL